MVSSTVFVVVDAAFSSQVVEVLISVIKRLVSSVCTCCKVIPLIAFSASYVATHVFPYANRVGSDQTLVLVQRSVRELFVHAKDDFRRHVELRVSV